MRITKAILLTIALLFMVGIAARAGAQTRSETPSQCVPFGGTIYGWHNGNSWFGVGDFTFGKKILHASVEDPNTGFDDKGDIWLGTEEATLTFASGEKITLMTNFVTEHQTDAAGTQGVYHVNETGSFARGTGRFQRAWGRFNLQGPFGSGIILPSNITPGTNDGWFWIGQYNGTVCGLKGDFQ
ncbi:MAG TPA: hypothetical protein VGS78_03285 [Candidatus Sulfotelmatobacter sp.]|nr:hypothetical protein [Candidatus Sulfotelmatobacter sp.]